VLRNIHRAKSPVKLKYRFVTAVNENIAIRDKSVNVEKWLSTIV